MSFTDAIRSVLNNATNFSGRARRSEYWWWVLAVFLGAVVVVAVSELLRFGTLVALYYVAAFFLQLGVSIRRLHDTNRTGWWLLIGLIPLIGGIILLVFYCTDGTPGDNAYGPSPKGIQGGYGGPGYGLPGYGQPGYGQPGYPQPDGYPQPGGYGQPEPGAPGSYGTPGTGSQG